MPGKHVDPRAVRDDSGYRLLIEGTPSPQFTEAFPQLVSRPYTGGRTMLEGPIADPSQLAGIVCDLCYRNTWILSLEFVDSLSGNTKPPRGNG